MKYENTFKAIDQILWKKQGCGVRHIETSNVTTSIRIRQNMDEQQNIIIYRTADGRASVALFAKDGKIQLNQQQMAELFATSKPNISMHIANILKEKELAEISVVKNFLTTAADGKNYNVVFYSLEMIIAVCYRVRGVRGTQFRQWATEHLTEYLVKGCSLTILVDYSEPYL